MKKKQFVFCVIFAITFNLVLSTPSLAIPSPDVVVGLFASAAQVLVLITAVLGGMGLTRKRKVIFEKRKQPANSQKHFLYMAIILLLISFGANTLQYAYQIDLRNTRLQANLVRSSVERGEKVGDVSLKTLSFSEQKTDPHGIKTEELQEYLKNPSKYNIVDVREPEEVESGMISQARHIHYPEILKNPQIVEEEGKETILFCYSGNRSGELCRVLEDQGMPCKFVVGGYEKWISEDRPIEAENRQELREIADYPNKNILLDTPEVQTLVKEKGAIFVDVRYPGDFDLGHLPHAVNIPARKLTVEENDKQINSLPKKPIIAACYDKRSCFYSVIMGLRLHRHGYDYLGRYTVPHEYIEVQTQKDHVQQWNINNDQTILGKFSIPLYNLLNYIYQKVGYLPLGILITVLLLRILIFPLTFKGERDQVILKDIAPSLKKLKEKYNNDRQKYSQALLKLYRKNNLTPTFNLLGTFAQILMFLLLFRVVDRLAQTTSESFLWLGSISQKDPYYILPLIVAALTIITINLNATSKPQNIIQKLLPFGGGAFLFFLTFNLSGAVNLYLVCSLLLMLLQRKIIASYLHKSQSSQSKFKPISPTKVIPLNFAHRVSGTGNKAARLGQLMEVGFNVPRGFVLPSPILANSKAHVELSPKHWQEINNLWQKLQLNQVAVRSSGSLEDGGDQSYAGMFSSVLNVSWEGFYDGLQTVYHSQSSQRVNAYQDEQSNIQLTGGILVQEMVKAEFSGVLFTKHPLENNSLLIEMISGLAEDLVSGKVTPKTYCFGRMTGQLLSEENPPINLMPLVEIGKKIEKYFEYPQDIEWSYSQGQFFILQARNITTLPKIQQYAQNEQITYDLFEEEKTRLINLVAEAKPDDIVFMQNELSELLPQPTPLSLSFMEAMWESGGTTDIACQYLGLSYDVSEDASPLITTVFGALYINAIEQKNHRYLNLNFLTTFSLIKKIDLLENEYKQIFLSYFLKEIRLKEVVDFSKLETLELFELFETWKTNFIKRTYVQAQMINIAADFSLKLAQRELVQKKLNPAAYLSNISETVVHKAMLLLPEIKAGKVPIADFLKIFGHRSLYDFELANPRYNEDNSLVNTLVENASFYSSSNKSELPQKIISKVVQVTIDRAKRFQTLKEEVKHLSLREFALIRKLLLELSQRLELDDGIFYFKLDEISKLKDKSFRQEAETRKKIHQQKIKFFNQLNPPTEITQKDLELFNLSESSSSKLKTGANEENLQGTLVAGVAPIEGQVQIIQNDEDIHNFESGNILVTRFTHPNWTPLFPKAKGVVTEIGGWLSHAAIVAREYDVPTIVGVKGALNNLKTGDWISLEEDGTIKKIKAKNNGKKSELIIKDDQEDFSEINFISFSDTQ